MSTPIRDSAGAAAGSGAPQQAARSCLWTLSAMAVAGLLLSLGYGWGISGIFAALGILTWAIGLLGVGLLVGFLFGLPKSGAKSNEVPRANANLEDISDWLSKIIVGTGLVELKSSPDYVRRLARLISGTLGPPIEHQSFGAAISVAFPVLGFLLGYVVTRIWLQREIVAGDKSLSLSELKSEIDRNRASIEANEQQAASAGILAKRALGFESLKGSDLSPLRAAAADLWDSDPHRGKFGGQPEANGRLLAAQIEPLFAGEPTCKLQLAVRSTDPARPLTKPVTFYLHPTYSDDVRVVEPRDGLARLDTFADGPFTVGATTDDGTTRLELDLAGVPGGTPEFYEQ